MKNFSREYFYLYDWVGNLKIFLHVSAYSRMFLFVHYFFACMSYSILCLCTLQRSVSFFCIFFLQSLDLYFETLFSIPSAPCGTAASREEFSLIVIDLTWSCSFSRTFAWPGFSCAFQCERTVRFRLPVHSSSSFYTTRQPESHIR